MKNTKYIKRGLVLLMAVSALLITTSPLNALYMPDDKKDDPAKSPAANKPMTGLAQAAQKAEGPKYAAGEVIIKLKEKNASQITYTQNYSQRAASNESALSGIKAKYKLTDEKPVFKALHNKLKANNSPVKSQATVDLLPIYVLKTNEDVLSVCEKLKSDPDIEYAEPNYIRRAQMVPNDPYYQSSGSWGQPYDDLWGIKKIRCEEAWDISQGEGVVVAVIDTGAGYNHEDLAQNIWINQAELNGQEGVDDDGNGYIDDIRGWDFAYGDNDPMDDYGHGTHVAGTIAAVGNNNKGVIGVAPKAKIMAIKGLNVDGYGANSDLANCINYAALMGANVINNSWGGSESSSLLGEVIKNAHSEGCIIIASAGNAGSDVANFYPANYPEVIAVSASDSNDSRADFSNFGYSIDVTAPGGDSGFVISPIELDMSKANIVSLRAANTDIFKNEGYEGDAFFPVPDDPESKYIRCLGTSMAAPVR